MNRRPARNEPLDQLRLRVDVRVGHHVAGTLLSQLGHRELSQQVRLLRRIVREALLEDAQRRDDLLEPLPPLLQIAGGCCAQRVRQLFEFVAGEVPEAIFEV
jgi:hypothetical protein